MQSDAVPPRHVTHEESHGRHMPEGSSYSPLEQLATHRPPTSRGRAPAHAVQFVPPIVQFAQSAAQAGALHVQECAPPQSAGVTHPALQTQVAPVEPSS